MVTRPHRYILEASHVDLVADADRRVLAIGYRDSPLFQAAGRYVVMRRGPSVGHEQHAMYICAYEAATFKRHTLHVLQVLISVTSFSVSQK